MMNWKEAIEKSHLNQAVRRDVGGGLIFRFQSGYGLKQSRGVVSAASRLELEGHEDWFPTVRCDPNV